MKTNNKITHILKILLIGVIGVQTFTACGNHSWQDWEDAIFGSSSSENESSSASGGEFTGDSPLLWQTVKTDYSIRNSADYFGDRYLLRYFYQPSVTTFVNEDGTVTVCVSDDNAKVAYIYEFSINLEEQKRLKFNYEFDKFGAFTKDKEGNYYFFYAKDAADVPEEDAKNEPENMAVVKYDKNGSKIKTYKLKPHLPGSRRGVRVPFEAGGCRLEISGSMLAVHFARLMFRGSDGLSHQASYNFTLNKDTFELDASGISYASHSFNQFILPINNGFVLADHGDAYPRTFYFRKYVPNEYGGFALSSFRFAGESGDNTTNAEMGGLAKTAGGYIFAGTYGNVPNKRDLFTLTIDEATASSISEPSYLTEYTEENVGHPKIVGIGSGKYLLLWELYKFNQKASSSQQSNYISTKMQIVGESGNALSPAKDLKDIRLSMNDVLRYNPKNGRVYWAINDLYDGSFTVYALDARYAYATDDMDLNLPTLNLDATAYGLVLTEFSSAKNSVLENEQFSVSFNMLNAGNEQFPGSSWFGAALMDEDDNIVEIIGTTKMIGAIDAGSKRGNTITCKVPSSVQSGQYRLRIVARPTSNNEWRVATMSVNNVPTAIDFTVR